MTEIENFLSSIQKSVKHDRQSYGKPNYNRIKGEIKKLFERQAGIPELSTSVFEYWEKTYIYNSTDEEPSEQNSRRLAAMLAFLKDDDEFEDELSDADWQELGRLVNFESEDLEIDVLQNLMKILVSKGAY